ncbi:hypothetical protein [Flavobacterium sp.]|uniref:hypothetical protein n=1 Tax=Flavobacterium sp. TaxID=239 RepID=UPI00374CF087
MQKKKSIRNSAHTENTIPLKKKLNILKIVILGILVSLGVFFIVKDSGNLYLKGNWNATKIIINGKDLLSPNSIYKYFDIGNQFINISGHSLQISINEQTIIANFKINHENKNMKIITFSSSENSLNGNFNMKIDTLHLGPQEYIVNIKLQHNKTFIHFEKKVIVPPWRPPFPKRGGV